MSKSFLIDTTRCTACRGCQVACKQWHDLPAEHTTNRGGYQNPPDLSFDTYKLVRMKEEVIGDRLQWLFFPDQCRHCIDAPCQATADAPDAIYTDEMTGAVLYTLRTRTLFPDEVVASCPYNIPRATQDGTIAKCDMCNDRVHNGLEPACVKTCPTGAMTFGDRNEILDLAERRLKTVQKKYPGAALLDPDAVRVIFLVAFDPLLYHESAIASLGPVGMTRAMALRRMAKPFTNLMRL